jgi:HEPN domain-containing protein
MCLLLEKAKKDYDTAIYMQKVNDELYLGICCFHIQQAIEKVLKCSIELKGFRYPYEHSISKLYGVYINAGWPEYKDLRMMAGTLTDWESSAGYKDSFAATISQLADALEIYKELEKRLVIYLTENNGKSSNPKPLQF